MVVPLTDAYFTPKVNLDGIVKQIKDHIGLKEDPQTEMETET